MIIGFYSYIWNILANFFLLSTTKKTKHFVFFVIFGPVYLFYNATR